MYVMNVYMVGDEKVIFLLLFLLMGVLPLAIVLVYDLFPLSCCTVCWLWTKEFPEFCLYSVLYPLNHISLLLRLLGFYRIFQEQISCPLFRAGS